jgi:ElaB/YqjD/DUF883 family membrane-anchored ribosome-binding protein
MASKEEIPSKQAHKPRHESGDLADAAKIVQDAAEKLIQFSRDAAGDVNTELHEKAQMAEEAIASGLKIVLFWSRCPSGNAHQKSGLVFMARIRETAGLIKETISDARTLFELEIKLLRAEVREMASFSKQIALLGAIAIAALVPAVLFLGLTLSALCSDLLNLPPWAGHAIVFGLFAAASVPVTEVETIKKEIEDTKALLAQKLETIEHQARDLVSPAHYIAEYPYLSMGVALGAGLIVGTQVKDTKKLLRPVALTLFNLLVSELEKKYVPLNPPNREPKYDN